MEALLQDSPLCWILAGSTMEEITLTGTFASTPQDFKKALELIATGEILVEDLISDRFTLDNMLNAVERAKKQEMIKGLVLFE